MILWNLIGNNFESYKIGQIKKTTPNFAISSLRFNTKQYI